MGWVEIPTEVLTLAYARLYSIRLWSEVKKSGKTFLAAVISIWEAVSNAIARLCAVPMTKNRP